MVGNNEERFLFVYNFVLNNGNGDILVSDEYLNKKELLEFICHDCKNNYLLSWDKFKQGKRCQKCSRIRQTEKDKNSIEYVKDYIEKNGNGDCLISCVYVDKKSPIDIYCHKHCGIYRITWDNFRQGRRCPECSLKNGSKKRYKSFCLKNGNFKDSFPEIASMWDYDKNNDVPENYSPFSNYKFYWVCPVCKLSYLRKISDMTRRKFNCSNCSNVEANKSLGNSRIEKILKEWGLLFEKEKRFKDCKNIRPLPFDFCIYMESSLILIEFQGRQHYEPVCFFDGANEENKDKIFEENKKKDFIKKTYCLENDIKLIEIPYWDFDKIEDILKIELTF